MSKVKKEIPNFKTEDEEREFWKTHDSSDYIDWRSANIALFPRLKPTLKTISIRLPENMIYKLKVLANKKDIPYQTLLKQFLSERLDSELREVA